MANTGGDANVGARDETEGRAAALSLRRKVDEAQIAGVHDVLVLKKGGRNRGKG